jgi:hypothetical protein
MSCLFSCCDIPAGEKMLGEVEELAEAMEPVEDESMHDTSRKRGGAKESRRINFMEINDLMFLMAVSVFKASFPWCEKTGLVGRLSA